MRVSDLAGKAVAIWGARREGRAAARALLALEAAPGSVVAVDDGLGCDPAAWDAACGGRVPLRLGPGGLERLLAADVVVKSPGVKPSHPWLRRLRDQGVTVTTGTALWLAEHRSHTVAVTGTKGKSTTAALIHRLLRALGWPATLSGNLGAPLLTTAEAALHVVELSSYQCADLGVSPQVAAVTALFPEHLDWHGSEERYYRDKLNLLAHGPAVAVLNGLDDRLRAWARPVLAASKATKVIFAGRGDSFHLAPGHDGRPWFHAGRVPLFPRAASPLPGAHNGANLCVALAALEALGVDCVAEAAALAGALAAFRGLPHRLEPIRDRTGRLFVDDSLATTPQATIAALDAYPEQPVTLIVGGADRGLDYGVLREHLRRSHRAAVVLAIPDSGPRIAATLHGLPAVQVEILPDLRAAVVRARQVTPPHGVVLLSPGAPSYGRFANFAERSEAFRRAIAETETASA
jgi:UDP-N-acetylmuramoylalanine--D-glutamate ligase